MAKSLFGKADPTLVNAALKEGLSNIPADMTEAFDAMTTTYKQTNQFLLDTATKMFEDTNASNEEMLKIVNPIYEQLQDGTFTDENMLEFKGVLDVFRDEWKAISRGKDGETQRMQWRSKVAKFNNGMKAFNKDLGTITTMIGNDQYVVGGADGVGGNSAAENMNFLTSIYNAKAGNEGNKAVMSVEKGEIFFTSNVETSDGTLKEIKMSQQDIKKLIPTTDHTALSSRETLLNNLKQVASKQGTSYNEKAQKDVADSLYRVITYSNNSRDTFQTLAHTGYGEESFYQALHNPFSSLTDVIKKGLLNINLPEKFDVAGEEGIDKADFENLENFNKIKKHIMNNPRVGGRLLADWTAATDGGSVFSIGENLRPVDNNAVNDQYNVFGNYKGKVYGGETIPGSGTYVENKTLNERRNQVIEIYVGNTKKDFFTGVFGQYDWKGNDTWENDGETYNTFQVMDREKIYASTGEFEQGLNAGGGSASSEGSKLTEDNIVRINNIWSDKMKEKSSANALNKILKDLGTDKRVYEDDAFSAYGLRFDNETFNINTPGDKQRLINVINQHLKGIEKLNSQNTETKSEEEILAEQKIKEYSSPGYNFNNTRKF